MTPRGELVAADITLSVAISDEQAEQAFRAAVNKSGMTVVAEVLHRFSPQGLTVVLVLAESHAALHTYPESNYLSVDVYTCGGSGNPGAVIDAMRAALPVVSIVERHMPRGSD